MKIEQDILTIHSKGRGTIDITESVVNKMLKSNLHTGLCQLFLKHTSASLILCENADPQVRKDLENFLLRLIPDGDPLFKHTAEGDDDMPAHIRTILTQTSLLIPIQYGKLALGTWQGIYLYEHRYAAQERKILMTFFGD